MQNRFVASEFSGRDPLDNLVARSRLIGCEECLVLWGGGNTSTKIEEVDPWGAQRTVLRIKGSGADLKAVERKHFPGLYLDQLLPMIERAEMTDEAMVDFVSRCFVEPGSARPSIETLLHAFVPRRCVDHSHADACLAITNTPRGEALAREVWGDNFLWIPYRRPGFTLSKEVGLAVRARPGADAVVLANHGLITFGADDGESYSRHIDYIDRAERWLAARRAEAAPPAPPPAAALLEALLPRLRGELSREAKVVLRFTPSDADSALAALLAHPGLATINAQGPATPDHTLHVRGAHCVVAAPDLSSPDALWISAREALERFRADYRRYFSAHTDGGQGEPRLDPRVIFIPGLGLVTAGKSARAARVAADIARHWAWIALAAESAGGYRSLPPKDRFAAEYWPLELYKLSLAPAEKSLARRAIVVTGAAGAIGSGIARRLLAEDACLLLADRDADGLAALERELGAPERVRALALELDAPGAAEQLLAAALPAFGGLDGAMLCAGVGASAPLTELSDADWERAFAVNSSAAFRLTRALLRLLEAQGTGGSLVFIATKNVFAPGAQFAAYSASKAAQLQLARVAALEGAAHGIRVNAVNPDAVFEGSKLWAEIGPGRAAAHGIDAGKLPEFYAGRNLLKTGVTAADVAEAALWLLSDASSKTTGAVIPVDGGIPGAFPR